MNFINFIKLGLILLGLSQAAPLQACDGGCPVMGSFFNGFLPQYQRHFMGMNWRYSSFYASNAHDGHSTSPSSEFYQSLELTGRFYLHPRVQVMAFVPVNFHTMKNAESKTQLIGLGDITLMGSYDIWNTELSDTGQRVSNHSLIIGGGIKVPTGAFQKQDASGILYTPSFQLGTGSVDFLVNTRYTFRHRKIGWNTNWTYKMNLPNANGYRLGNQLMGNLFFFTILDNHHAGWGFVPRAGVQFEHSSNNQNNGFLRTFSGGSQVLTSAGLDFFYKRIQVGFSYEQPIYQDIAQGHIENKSRFNATFNYLF